MGKSTQQIIAEARDALHDDEIEYSAILAQWERGQEVATVDLVSALAWRVNNQRRELGKLNARLKEVRELVEWLPITTEELLRLRNANVITFHKQVNSITTCLIQLQRYFARNPGGGK